MITLNLSEEKLKALSMEDRAQLGVYFHSLIWFIQFDDEENKQKVDAYLTQIDNAVGV